MSHKKAFLVGINYKKTSNELNGCINDVLHIREILITKYKYLPGNILLMTDDTALKPTAANIKAGWNWLLTKNTKRDFGKTKVYSNFKSTENPVLFFHYSGHGSYVRDAGKDEVDGRDEALCPLDFTKAGLIKDDVIRSTFINRVPANAKLISIIDACHSESSLDLLWNVKIESDGSFKINKLGSYQETPGNVVCLSGCTDKQTSADLYV